MGETLALLRGPDDCGPVVIGGFFLLIVAGATFWAHSARQMTLEESIRSLGSRWPGTMNDPGLFERRRYEFHVAGRDARIVWKQSSKNNPAWTEVVVDVRGLSPGALKISKEGFLSSIGKAFGLQDLKIGDPEFDSRFVVKANPESLALKILRPLQRSRPIQAMADLSPYASPVVDLSRETLAVRVSQYLVREVDLRSLIEGAEAFMGAVGDAKPPEGVVWIDAPASKGGQCQVCCTDMGASIVRCERCQTPHHRECWEFNGRCSTFACGGSRAS